MALSTRRIAMFADVKKILDEALASGGGTVTLLSHGAAVHWRQRAYQFRKMYATQIDTATSPYDRLTFRKVPDESSSVTIAVIEQKAIFTPAEGGRAVIPQKDDGLEAEAERLRKELGIDI